MPIPGSLQTHVTAFPTGCNFFPIARITDPFGGSSSSVNFQLLRIFCNFFPRKLWVSCVQGVISTHIGKMLCFISLVPTSVVRSFALPAHPCIVSFALDQNAEAIV
jgi:hypothetical protein